MCCVNLLLTAHYGICMTRSNMMFFLGLQKPYCGVRHIMLRAVKGQ